MRVLVAEDAPLLLDSLKLGLGKLGYAVDAAPTGTEAQRLCRQNPYDVIVLDIMLPGLDGLSLLRSLRQAPGPSRHAGVLLLTARDTVADRVTGLRSGADDYLVKPFAFDELAARIEALIRRRHASPQTTLTIGPLSLDTSARTCTVARRPIDLTAREYSLLEYLARRRGHVVARTDIEAHLYDRETEIMSNAVDAAVYALRKKLDLPDQPSLIRTVRGMGYVLTEASPAAPPEATA
jgi:DNA-binding response OmpR family regulator